MNNQCEGIILKTQEYKERDLIVTVYSKEYGLLTFHARGVRKMQSKNAYALSLYAHSRIYFDYHENKTMYSLKSAEKITVFRHLYEDLEKQAIASVIAELAYSLKLEASESFYSLLISCLKQLNDSNNFFGVLGFYLAKCCEYIGITPAVDGCVKCNNTTSIATISIVDGGFICKYCYDGNRHRKYNLETLQTFRIMVKSSITDLETVLNLKQYSYGEIEVILDLFLEYSGVVLKSVKFLYKLFKQA